MTGSPSSFPYRLLWLRVLEQAFADATSDSESKEVRRERQAADGWIRGCGRDFRQACNLAGLDPEFLSDAYKAGRVNGKLLRKSMSKGDRSK